MISLTFDLFLSVALTAFFLPSFINANSYTSSVAVDFPIPSGSSQNQINPLPSTSFTNNQARLFVEYLFPWSINYEPLSQTLNIDLQGQNIQTLNAFQNIAINHLASSVLITPGGFIVLSGLSGFYLVSNNSLVLYLDLYTTPLWNNDNLIMNIQNQLKDDNSPLRTSPTGKFIKLFAQYCPSDQSVRLMCNNLSAPATSANIFFAGLCSLTSVVLAILFFGYFSFHLSRNLLDEEEFFLFEQEKKRRNLIIQARGAGTNNTIDKDLSLVIPEPAAPSAVAGSNGSKLKVFPNSDTALPLPYPLPLPVSSPLGDSGSPYHPIISSPLSKPLFVEPKKRGDDNSNSLPAHDHQLHLQLNKENETNQNSMDDMMEHEHTDEIVYDLIKPKSEEPFPQTKNLNNYNKPIENVPTNYNNNSIGSVPSARGRIATVRPSISLESPKPFTSPKPNTSSGINGPGPIKQSLGSVQKSGEGPINPQIITSPKKPTITMIDDD